MIVIHIGYTRNARNVSSFRVKCQSIEYTRDTGLLSIKFHMEKHVIWLKGDILNVGRCTWLRFFRYFNGFLLGWCDIEQIRWAAIAVAVIARIAWRHTWVAGVGKWTCGRRCCRYRCVTASVTGTLWDILCGDCYGIA